MLNFNVSRGLLNRATWGRGWRHSSAFLPSFELQLPPSRPHTPHPGRNYVPLVIYSRSLESQKYDVKNRILVSCPPQHPCPFQDLEARMTDRGVVSFCLTNQLIPTGILWWVTCRQDGEQNCCSCS